MQHLNSFVALLVFARLATAATTLSTCAADNCYRAVKASAFPSRSTSQDCAAFLATTTTSVSTKTIFSGTTNLFPTPLKRDIMLEARAAVVPAYASACSGDVRYSSACSCIGVTAPTVTVTSTATVVSPTATATVFALKVSGAGASEVYVASDYSGGYGINYYKGLPSPNGEAAFLLRNGQLFTISGDRVQAGQGIGGSSLVYGSPTIQSSQLACSIGSGGAFTCVYDSGLSYFALCHRNTDSRSVAIASSTDFSNVCDPGTISQITLMAIPLGVA